jgi:hypothetical protein
MADAKCSDLRPILKEIDKDFDISFDWCTEKYTVTHKGNYFMQVKYGEFDRKTVDNIRKAVWLNKTGRVFDEIDRHNAKVEASKDREISNMAECMAKDIRKPLLNMVG